MPIIGTAGHVDHGKSTLVRALTGIDPDRLAEEKRRGMTIDLGFANIILPSGQRAGVVDVPGHARFLPNMLAGVHGMDVVLLVVAADEGVRQQTREHLDILQLLGVTRLVVALAKADLVDEAFLRLSSAEVLTELAGRGLTAPVIPVSVPQGRGLDEVRVALAEALAGVAPPDLQRPRLPVDRAFTMTGFGTVVTGSLVDGALAVGRELELFPAKNGARVRVRGLEQYGDATDKVPPGNRVAANLSGIGADEIRRGQVLAPPGSVPVSTRLDVSLRVLPRAGRLRHGERVAVYTGTAEVSARLVVLDAGSIEPGDEALAQLRLDRPVAVRDGDLLVLRRPSPSETVAGGEIVDATAPARRRGQTGEAIAERQSHVGRLLAELDKARAGVERAQLSTRLALPAADVEALLEALMSDGRAVAVGSTVFGGEAWAGLERRARAAVERFQAANRLRAGMPLEALRSSLRLDGGSKAALEVMIARGSLEAVGAELVRTPGYAPEPTAAEKRAISSAVDALRARPLSPPSLADLHAVGLNDDLAKYLDEQGIAVRIGQETLMLPDALAEAERRVRAFLKERGEMTVADARDLLQSSRRTVVPLLEHFDSHRLTRREGDTRRLRG